MSRPGAGSRRRRARAGGTFITTWCCWPRMRRGYKNLIKLSTAAHLEGYYYKPRIDKELLAAHKEGLIALSGCLASEIPESIQRDQLPRAREAIDWFKQTLGAENFYLELQNHGLPEQAKVNRHLIAWAKEFGLKLVATNDVHYVEKSHSHAHDCLICIGTQTQLTDTKRLQVRGAAVLSAFGGGDEGALRRGPGGGAEHAGGGREVQPGDRVREAPLPGLPSARSTSRAKATCGICWPRDCANATASRRGPKGMSSSSRAWKIRGGCRRMRKSEVRSPKSEVRAMRHPMPITRSPPRIKRHATRNTQQVIFPIPPSRRPSRRSSTGCSSSSRSSRRPGS